MNLREAKEHLLNGLMKEGYLKTPAVIGAFRSVRRERFVPDRFRNYAYMDEPLPIGWGQTISAPHMVAIMTELLDLRPEKTLRVLEIGSGSGYQAAILSKLAGEVWTVEFDVRLARFAADNLRAEGAANVHVLTGDGWLGHEKEAPYDRIIVTCAVPSLPPALKRQLKVGGMMLAPVGGHFYQNLLKAEKRGSRLVRTSYGACVFVPLRRPAAGEGAPQ